MVSSGHLIYRLLIQEAEENVAASSIWSIYAAVCDRRRGHTPISFQVPSVLQKSTLLLGSPVQHLQAQLQSRQACLLPGTSVWRDLQALGWGFLQGCHSCASLENQAAEDLPDLSAPFKKQHNEDKYLAISAASTTT